MRVWRLVAAPFVKHAFTGEGARVADGRWNPKGVLVVYTAASLVLAALEPLVHADDDLLPTELVYFAVDIPDEIAMEHVATGDLPPDWRTYPSSDALQDVGAAWVVRCASAVLAVASAVIPEERNFLLNPRHPDFARIEWDVPQPFRFDPRLRRVK